MPSRAEQRGAADLEFMTLHRGPGGNERDTVFTMGGTVGARTGNWVPYVGAGLGFFTAQLRAGIAWYPNGLYDSGVLVRLEARPQILAFQCLQPAIMGQAALGYRWSLQYRHPEEDPGPGFYVLPAFEAGPAWIRAGCGSKDPKDEAPSKERTFLLGGTIVGGLDW